MRTCTDFELFLAVNLITRVDLWQNSRGSRFGAHHDDVLLENVMKKPDLVETPLRSWRRPLKAVLVLTAGLFLAPVDGHASPLWTTFALAFNYGNLEFGPDLGHARIEELGLGNDEEDTLWPPLGDEGFPIVGGVLTMTTGRLLEIVPNRSDANYHHAGGGAISLQFTLALPDGSLHDGTFDARLGPYVIYADEDGGGGDTEGAMRSGLFDEATARLLGIKRRTLPTVQYWYLDSYDSYPESYRVAKSFGYLDIPVQVAPVPEPSTLPLWLLALGGFAYWRVAGNAHR